MVLKSYENLVEQDDLQSDVRQEKAVSALHDLSEKLKKKKSSNAIISGIFSGKAGYGIKGVYMWGGVGRGKTMLMDLFVRSLPKSVKVRRVHFNEFMREVHEFLHKQRKKKEQKKDKSKSRQSIMLKYADSIKKQADIVCFDEFHVTDIGDAMILGKLFALLFERGVVVVSTSNWQPDRLYEGGLQRDQFEPFIDLIKENMDIVHLDGETDYRSLTLGDAGTYFFPLDSAEVLEADKLFKKLVASDIVRSEIIEVKGREIEVSQAAGGIARFSFSQLCERPLGAGDYLAISEKYHTIFVENIPKLGYDRRNEAKRFMTLIDTLYDKHVNLIVTADTQVDSIYRGDDYAFEFKRTTSRLK